MSLELGDNDRWGPLFGPGWKGKRILGKGAFGIVGLWEYEGTPAPPITQMAIKQFHSKDSPNWTVETGIMQRLAKVQSKHIIRQYVPPRTIPLKDGSSLIAMFLEYCPGGDLSKFIQPNEPPILEIDLWAMFHCLALAMSVLARGTEDPNSPPVGHGLRDFELVHYEYAPYVSGITRNRVDIGQSQIR